jgi:hypothetical protein
LPSLLIPVDIPQGPELCFRCAQEEGFAAQKGVAAWNTKKEIIIFYGSSDIFMGNEVI